MFGLARLRFLTGDVTWGLWSRVRGRALARRKHSGPTALVRLEELDERIVPSLFGQQLFPSDNPWNQNIANAPVASNSNSIITHIGSSIKLHPDWGADSAANGSSPLYGIPVNIVHGNSTAKVKVTIDNYPGESDLQNVPIPANAVIEGDNQNGPNTNGAGYNTGQRGDSHLIIWDEDTNTAYELFGVSRPTDTTLFPNTSGVELNHTDSNWHAAQESVWDMTKDTFRTLGATSADAAGLSILAGLVRPDEGLTTTQGGQGAINHALRMTLPSGDILPTYIYPASHMVSTSTGANKVPLGTRLRLANTPAINTLINNMPPESQIIAKAMQQYGLIVADIGSAMYVTGASATVNTVDAPSTDLTWDMNDIFASNGLSVLTAGDFQVVNLQPVVTSLSASSGASGNTITINGQNFSGAAGNLSVFFGTTAATTVTVKSDTQISVVVPSGTGTVDVTVQSGLKETDTISSSPNANVNAPIFGYGTSATSAADQFTYSGSSVTLTSISVTPANPTGTVGGTLAFTATGTYSDNSTQVLNSGVTWSSSKTAIATVNSSGTATELAVGTSTITATVGSVSGSTTLTVNPPAPSVTGLSPSSGPAAGGNTITITGSSFTGATAVSFGGTAATSFQVVSDTKITATDPAGTVGQSADVTVTTPSGTSAKGSADKFTYINSIVVNGASGDTLAITATSANGGSYTLNNGSPVSFSGITQFTFNGAGNNTLVVTYPSGGIFAPASGTIFNGGTGTNTLTVNAASAMLTTVPGGLASGGAAILTYSNVAVLNLNKTTALDAAVGPDTQDRASALAGLTAQERFVQVLYLDDLGRAGAKAELDAFTPLFSTPGLTQTQAQAIIARGIAQSSEARVHLVKTWYQNYLGRTAQTSEAQLWASLLLNGQTEEQVLSQLLGTSEFYTHAQSLITTGTADQRYVQALYQVLLARSADTASLSMWVSNLSTMGRQGVVMAILQSQEFRTDQFEGYYNALLHRPSDSAGLKSVAKSMADIATIRIAFESTTEFYNNG
jgi:hypothetical protein